MTLDSRTTTRSDLEGKRLPELHEMAQGMGVSGYQRLRKGDLIDAIMSKSAGDGRGSADNAGESNGEVSHAEAPEKPAAGDESGSDSEGNSGSDSGDESPARRRATAGRTTVVTAPGASTAAAESTVSSRTVAAAVAAAASERRSATARAGCRATSAGGSGRSDACARWRPVRRRSPRRPSGRASSTSWVRATASSAPAGTCRARTTSTCRSARSDGSPCERATRWRARSARRATTRSTTRCCRSRRSTVSTPTPPGSAATSTS